jgi:putative membrane protein
VIGLLIALVINAVALFAAVNIVPGMKLDWEKSPLTLIAVAAIFALVNTFLRPILRALTLPIRLLTLGIVGFLINVALLLLVAYIAHQLKLPFTISGWAQRAFTVDVAITAILASLVISIVSTVVSLAIRGTRLVVPGI